MLNLTRLHLGIAHESQFQGLGIRPRTPSFVVGTACVGASHGPGRLRQCTGAAPAAQARILRAYFACSPDSLTIRSAVSRSSRMKRANSSNLTPDGSTARSM